jgi:hypothetical protein
MGPLCAFFPFKSFLLSRLCLACVRSHTYWLPPFHRLLHLNTRGRSSSESTLPLDQRCPYCLAELWEQQGPQWFPGLTQMSVPLPPDQVHLPSQRQMGLLLWDAVTLGLIGSIPLETLSSGSSVLALDT